MLEEIPRPETQPLIEQFAKFQQQYQGNDQIHLAFAEQLFHQGLFQEATWYYMECINNPNYDSSVKRLYLLAANCYYHLKQFKWAKHLLKQIIHDSDDDISVVGNYAICCYAMGEKQEAVKYLKKCLAIQSDSATTLSWLARVYSELGENKKARKYGERTFKVRDKATHEPDNLALIEGLTGNRIEVTSKVPLFDPSQPLKNIIAFSLWGDKPHYYKGILENITVAKAIYPGWVCRVYCDNSVSESFRKEITSAGGQVALMNEAKKSAYEGLFWRFLTADDSAVDRYIIRDADCLLNCKERIAVDQWIESDKHFHIMRDHASHTPIILAGLWGGVRGALPPLRPMILDHLKKVRASRDSDQLFLEKYIWPYVKKSHLTHDSVYNYSNSRPYEKYGDYPQKDYCLSMTVFSEEPGDQ